jgi:hypothetical protein
MRSFLPGLLSTAIVACATSPGPQSGIAGVSRVSTLPGCYKHVSGSDWNVRLSNDLEASLLRLINESPGRAGCWYERRDGQLIAVIGDECGPHREAFFQHTAGEWVSVKVEEVPVVLCDERRR